MNNKSIKETIDLFSNENGFSWGTNTVIKSLAPDACYDLTAINGEFIINHWDSNFPQPTSREIRDEYIRQQTIAECLKYFEENKNLKYFFKKLFKF